MKKRIKVFAVVGVVIVLLGYLILSLPQERLLLSEEYMDLELYPTYYYTNFTVVSSDTNGELFFDVNIDFGGNYSSYTALWNLYQLPLEQFEQNFNLTEVHDVMSEGNWDGDDFGAFWAGWFVGNSFYPAWMPIPSGAYIFVFWIESDESTTGWSATLTVSLRTSILPRA